MDENRTTNPPDSIQVALGSSEYSLVVGGSVDVEILLTNPGPSDYFVVNLLGIPPSWIKSSGAPAVWIATGGQERVSFSINPPGTAAGIAGSYQARVYVFSQNAPAKGKEIPFLLIVTPKEQLRKTFTLRVDSQEITTAPGSNLRIPLIISNSSPESQFLELAVEGVPANWISLPSPVITLLGGEDKVVDLFLQVPAAPEIRAGSYPLKISLASQKDPTLKEQVEIKLGIAAFESQGPVGVMLASLQFSTAPGGSFVIPLTVLNRGLEPATFRLGIEGIPVNWVSTSTPVIALQPGESKEVAVLIRPPLSSASQAGRRKFRIVVMSQDAPDQVVKVDCILTLAAVTQFSAGLAPEEVEAGKLISVVVKNEGNTPQQFRLTLTSQGAPLVFQFFEPELAQQSAGGQGNVSPGVAAGAAGSDPTLMHIPPGETGAFRFTARPVNKPWIGGETAYPYQAVVDAGQKQSPVMQGTVTSGALIPVWVLAVALILCLWLAFSASFAFFGGRFKANSATQTATAATAQAIGVTQTIIANQTAAAAAGLQDTDGDGLTNQQEGQIGTDPNNADTDGDGLLDGQEVQLQTNPLLPDSDGDGLSDGDEVKRTTNPLNRDTDGDGLADGDEVTRGTNPLNPDTDGDSLADGAEIGKGTNPLNPDTDGDGIIDGKDLDPLDPNNPSLTATAIASQPTATLTPIPTVAVPTITLTPPPVASPTSQLPSFPGTILFSSNRDGNNEIYTTNASAQVSRITNNPSADIQAVWDPGMQRIAFTTNRDGQNEIYVMNANGSNPINVTNNPADDQNPTWSIDGQWIAFTSNRDGNYEIYVVRVSNLETHNLTNSPGNDTQPNWVRSRTGDAGGEAILFTSNRDGNLEIYRMKTDGSGQTNLTNNPSNDQQARSSPDGSQIAFTSDRTGNQEVFSMSIDGQNPVDLTNSPANDFEPAWSRDQAWIAFTSDRVGNRDIFVMQPSLPNASDVTNNPAQDEVTDWK